MAGTDIAHTGRTGKAIATPCQHSNDGNPLAHNAAYHRERTGDFHPYRTRTALRVNVLVMPLVTVATIVVDDNGNNWLLHPCGDKQRIINMEYHCQVMEVPQSNLEMGIGRQFQPSYFSRISMELQNRPFNVPE